MVKTMDPIKTLGADQGDSLQRRALLRDTRVAIICEQSCPFDRAAVRVLSSARGYLLSRS